MLVHDTFELVVQVNGKVRDRFDVPADTPEDELIERAKASPRVQAHMNGKTVRKAIVVPRKLVNLVVGYAERLADARIEEEVDSVPVSGTDVDGMGLRQLENADPHGRANVVEAGRERDPVAARLRRVHPGDLAAGT